MDQSCSVTSSIICLQASTFSVSLLFSMPQNPPSDSYCERRTPRSSPLPSMARESFVINHLYIISTTLLAFLLITCMEFITTNHQMYVWVLSVIISECSLSVSLISCFPPGVQTALGPWLSGVCVWMCLCCTWICVCINYWCQLPLHEIKLYFEQVFLTLDRLWNHILLLNVKAESQV